MSTARFETMWLPCGTLEPGNEGPQPIEAWQEALEDGWEPAGPSMQVATPDMIVCFAMVRRPINRLTLFGVSNEVSR